MRFLILIPLIVLTLLSSAWIPPQECDDADREIPNNRSSQCKLVLPELTNIEYRFDYQYPSCWEELVFHFPGIVPSESPRGLGIWVVATDRELVPNRDSSGNIRTTNPPGAARVYGYDENGMWSHSTPIRVDIVHDAIILYNPRLYGVNSGIMADSLFGDPTDSYFGYSRMGLFVESRRTNSSSHYVLLSNALTRPSTLGKVSLANDCLALVRQETAERAHKAAEETAAAEAAAQATAIADAAAKEAERAQRERELQARIAKLEQKTAAEAQLKIAEAEATKTATVKAQLEHQQRLTEIFQETVRIQLAGQGDRARLLNEHLLNASTTAATFDEEVRAAEARINAYVEFNRQLLSSLEAYYAGLLTRLETANGTLATQQQRASELEQEIQAIEVELENATSTVATSTEQ